MTMKGANAARDFFLEVELVDNSVVQFFLRTAILSKINALLNEWAGSI